MTKIDTTLHDDVHFYEDFFILFTSL